MRWLLTAILMAGFVASASTAGPKTATMKNTPAGGSATPSQETSQPSTTPVNTSPTAGTGTPPGSNPQPGAGTVKLPARSTRKKHLLSTLPLTPQGEPTPQKVVVKRGGAREPAAQIATDMDPAEATRKREDSERLLGVADENLKQLTGRTLNDQQEETVSQIDHYMKVARSALGDGDITRGHTLALKASLLAQDLAKHK